MLGDLLASLTDETTALETILGAGDLNMLVAMRAQAQADGVELGTYVAQTVQRYANEAPDEEWITLMGLLNRSLDPGRICLARAFEHALRH